jgi:hypothetical protein
MTLTNNRRLQPGVTTVLDTIESVFTEIDGATKKNISYAVVAQEGDTDSQWTFAESLETTVGVDLMDALTFESLDEDGGYRHFRVKGEFTAIDTGIIAGEAEVDYVVVGVYVNGEQVAASELGDPAEAAASVNFDTIITVKDGDIVQFPMVGVSSKAEEVDVTFEVDEAAIIIN